MTVVVIVVAACGQGTEREAVVEDATLGPLVEEPRAESADATAAATTTTAEDEVPASGGDGDVTEPSRASDLVATPELLERCSDVAQIRADVLSDPPRANPDPIVMDVFESYVDERADTFGGLWIDREAFGTVVLSFTDDPAPHRAALAQRRPSLDDLPPVILPRRPGDPWPPVSVEPTAEITDDRPIGERGVAFDVVQVSYTQADLIGAIDPVLETAQTITEAVVEGGFYPSLNRVGIHLSTPVSETELVAIMDAIDDLGGVSLDMVCWSGQLVDEAADPGFYGPPPIEPGTPLNAIRIPGDDGTFPPDTPVTCDVLEFELGDLENLVSSTDVDPDLKSVLDDWLADRAVGGWPQDGWVLLDADDERASFIHVSDDGVSYFGAEMGANGWIWAGFGGPMRCDVRLTLPPGIGQVEWMLDPSAPPPDPTSTEIRVLVTERGCASGQEMGDRLLGPQVVETTDAVLLAFGAIVQPDVQECPSSPSTPVEVKLDAPLGDRELRDGMVIGSITSLLAS